MSDHKPFDFGTEFSADGEVLRSSTVRKAFTAEEVEPECEKARAEGAKGAEGQAAQALQTLASQMQLALAQTGAISAAASEMALAAARKIAGEALANAPDAELTALIEACASELRGAPRLRARLPDSLMETLKPRLEQAVADIGFEGRLIVEPMEGGAPGAVSLDWEDGAVTFDPSDTADRIEHIVRARLDPDGAARPADSRDGDTEAA